MELASTLVNLLEKGELLLRATHNDTKYNNILMDKDTLKPLCVIDLIQSCRDWLPTTLEMLSVLQPTRRLRMNRIYYKSDMRHYEEFTRIYDCLQGL